MSVYTENWNRSENSIENLYKLLALFEDTNCFPFDLEYQGQRYPAGTLKYIYSDGKILLEGLSKHSFVFNGNIMEII